MSLDKDLQKSYDLEGKKIFNLSLLSSKSLQKSIDLFEYKSLIIKKPKPIDVKVYTLVSGQSFSVSLIEEFKKIKNEIKIILNDTLCYWVKPENLGVEYCVFKWPNDLWNEKWLNQIISFMDSKEYDSFELKISGIQLHPDGCIIAKGYDNGKIRNIRTDLMSNLPFIPSKQSNWAHIPLGRILEPVSGKIFNKLKKTMKQLSDKHISVEKIIDQKLIYETKWYMEKKKILYLKQLKQKL
jgi:hypothetical protein